MQAQALPTLPPERLHLPFEAGPFRMAMGLVACPPGELIELDERYPAEMAERRTLLDTRHEDVFAACPGSGPAGMAVLARLASLLPERFPTCFRRNGTVLCNRVTGEDWDLGRPLPHDPLEVAGRLVQEDLCVLRLGSDGPMLDAAVLCAPSRWRLAEKIGKPLGAIHGPVPLYAERLGHPVDRLMRQLKPGRVAMRMNWSVVDDPALFQPGGKHRTAVDATITAANAGTRLHLRTERQTLSRLDPGGTEGGHVLFTIRVHSHPVDAVAAVPGAAARLAEAVRALPPDMARYKSLPVFRDALLGFLDAAAS